MTAGIPSTTSCSVPSLSHLGAVVKLNKNFRYTARGGAGINNMLALFSLQGYGDAGYVVSRIPGFTWEMTTIGAGNGTAHTYALVPPTCRQREHIPVMRRFGLGPR